MSAQAGPVAGRRDAQEGGGRSRCLREQGEASQPELSSAKSEARARVGRLEPGTSSEPPAESRQGVQEGCRAGPGSLQEQSSILLVCGGTSERGPSHIVRA